MLIVNLILLLMIKDMWCIRELCEFCYLWLKMLCDAYVNCVNFDFLGRELMIKETVLFWFFSWVANNISNLSVTIDNNNSRVANKKCDYGVADVICDSYVTDIICDSIKYAKFLNIFLPVLFY